MHVVAFLFFFKVLSPFTMLLICKLTHYHKGEGNTEPTILVVLHCSSPSHACCPLSDNEEMRHAVTGHTLCTFSAHRAKKRRFALDEGSGKIKSTEQCECGFCIFRVSWQLRLLVLCYFVLPQLFFLLCPPRYSLGRQSMRTAGPRPAGLRTGESGITAGGRWQIRYVMSYNIPLQKQRGRLSQVWHTNSFFFFTAVASL